MRENSTQTLKRIKKGKVGRKMWFKTQRGDQTMKNQAAGQPE
jgi:hypothetical protein